MGRHTFHALPGFRNDKGLLAKPTFLAKSTCLCPAYTTYSKKKNYTT